MQYSYYAEIRDGRCYITVENFFHSSIFISKGVLENSIWSRYPISIGLFEQFLPRFRVWEHGFGLQSAHDHASRLLLRYSLIHLLLESNILWNRLWNIFENRHQQAKIQNLPTRHTLFLLFYFFQQQQKAKMQRFFPPLSFYFSCCCSSVCVTCLSVSVCEYGMRDKNYALAS